VAATYELVDMLVEIGTLWPEEWEAAASLLAEQEAVRDAAREKLVELLWPVPVRRLSLGLSLLEGRDRDEGMVLAAVLGMVMPPPLPPVEGSGC
jgi:hypothetical protein